MTPGREDLIDKLPVFERSIEYDAMSGCWLWSRSLNRTGYGQIRVGNHVSLSHRFAYAALVGPLNGDDVVLHRCDTPSCVNPDHLRKGTQADNVADMAAKARRGARAGRPLSSDEIREVRSLGHLSIHEAAERLGWRPETIRKHRGPARINVCSTERTAARFFSQVEMDPNGGCWLWSGCLRKGGGKFSAGGRTAMPHRYAYEAFVGPIPTGGQLLSRCGVPLCVNPHHFVPKGAAA